jgi:hypothetical protein
MLGVGTEEYGIHLETPPTTMHMFEKGERLVVENEYELKPLPVP